MGYALFTQSTPYAAARTVLKAEDMRAGAEAQNALVANRAHKFHTRYPLH